MNLAAFANLGRYGKFYTAIAGELVAYLQLYGPAWHLVPAVTMAGAALAVYGVPNAPKPAPVTPAAERFSAPPNVPPVSPPASFTPPAGSV
jgi:hypothetical protein